MRDLLFTGEFRIGQAAAKACISDSENAIAYNADCRVREAEDRAAFAFTGLGVTERKLSESVARMDVLRNDADASRTLLKAAESSANWWKGKALNPETDLAKARQRIDELERKLDELTKPHSNLSMCRCGAVRSIRHRLTISPEQAFARSSAKEEYYSLAIESREQQFRLNEIIGADA